MVSIEDLARQCVERKASDIYLKVGAPPMLRISGVATPAGTEPLRPEETQAIAEQLMKTERDRETFARDQSVNLAWSAEGIGRFRVNIYMQRGTVALCLRKVETTVPTLDGLNLPPILKELAMSKNGLVLVTGATGSGKSTTLAAMIDYRNENAAGHIITMEDPIEFLHPDKKSIVSQREIGTDSPSFEEAIKDALRQAPDVILLGEMRDRHTVEAALHMAETGHLALGTIHATNAPQTIERILNLFPADEQDPVYMHLANNLRGIVSQRLVPRADGQGRVAAMEILVATQRIRDLIMKRELSELKMAIAQGREEGMQTFDQHLYELCQQGIISQETALAFAESPGDLRLRLRGFSIGGT